MGALPINALYQRKRQMFNILWNDLVGPSVHGQQGSSYQYVNNYSYANQGMAGQTLYNINRMSYDWVWNGKPMTLTEFADKAYGDTPQKTMFLLKHSDKEK